MGLLLQDTTYSKRSDSNLKELGPASSGLSISPGSTLMFIFSDVQNKYVKKILLYLSHTTPCVYGKTCKQSFSFCCYSQIIIMPFLKLLLKYCQVCQRTKEGDLKNLGRSFLPERSWRILDHLL